MKTMPLWSLADVRTSNVDKKSKEGESAVRLVNYTDVYYNHTISSEMELMTATASPEHIARFSVQDDDIIITKDSESPDDIGVPAIVAGAADDMVCAYHLSLLRPDPRGVNARFLHRVLESDIAKQHWFTSSFGVTRYSILSGTISRLPIPANSADKQRAIADYLDHETAEIDAMIAKMDELAEALQARRLHAASHFFVTSFDSVKLKWLFDEIDMRAGNLSPELPLLSVSIHHGVQLRDDSSSNQKPSADVGHYKVAQTGDIVLNRMRAFQGGLGVARVEGLVSPDYSVLRPRTQLSSTWAEYVMRTPEFIAAMTRRLRGIGAAEQGNVRTPRINVPDLFELEIPLPSRDEQRKLTHVLDDVTGKIDAMLAKVAELKSLLTERRAALITEVVTGRKEVT